MKYKQPMNKNATIADTSLATTTEVPIYSFRMGNQADQSDWGSQKVNRNISATSLNVPDLLGKGFTF